MAGTALLAERWGIAAATGEFHILFGKVVYAGMLVPFIAGTAWLWRARRGRSAHRLA